MNNLNVAVLLVLAVFSSTTRAEDIDVGRIFVESMVEGAKEGICGDKDSVHWMMRSTDEAVRKQGYACFGVGQAEKINGRLQGKTTGADKGCQENSETSKCGEAPTKTKSAPAYQVNQDTKCRNENGHIKCKIWFPETKINGQVIPAGYRDVEMGGN